MRLHSTARLLRSFNTVRLGDGHRDAPGCICVGAGRRGVRGQLLRDREDWNTSEHDLGPAWAASVGRWDRRTVRVNLGPSAWLA